MSCFQVQQNIDRFVMHSLRLQSLAVIHEPLSGEIITNCGVFKMISSITEGEGQKRAAEVAVFCNLERFPIHRLTLSFSRVKLTANQGPR
jgi:hypothetical protein